MRQFVSDCLPDKDGCLYIEGKNFRYLSSVLRLEAGDMLYVRLPDGALQDMTVAKVDGGARRITLTVAGTRACGRFLSAESDGNPADGSASSAKSAAPVREKPLCRMWLFQFAAKPPKMDLIIRQAAECGVERIVPVIGKFCQRGSVDSCLKKASAEDTRWARIITEAREQSGSPVNTCVQNCLGLAEACRLWSHSCQRGRSVAVVLYEQSAGTMSLHEALRCAGDGTGFDDAAVMVGAEGGIAPEEVKIALDAGFVPVHFDTNILRCETAALYGIAALQNALTESEKWLLKE